jgi:UDP-N-acetylglucosamine--N-acetylmuramyl-(pentapeptide) pyrophosphoryl-undecaprenol N-acetylglucosamine transferase
MKRKGISSVRLLICAGGTGGGVYPALAVHQALIDPDESVLPHEDLTTLWVGGRGGMEADLVKRAGIAFEAISAAGVHGVGLPSLPGNLLQLGRGYFEARRVVDRFRPDALLFTGGFVAVPMALAGRRVPGLLYVPDIEPGLALKTLARFADRLAVTTADTCAYFPAGMRSKAQVTGYPTRRELRRWDPEKARQALELSADSPVLLVFGGSKGARSINRALLAVLPQLLAEMQVVHISGQLDWPEVESARQALEARLGARYRAYPYLHEQMGAALSAADLVLSRAGASSLGEFPAFGLPAILVPYPYAWRYQQVNAAYLQRHGAALLIPDAELPERLLSVVLELVHDGQRRAQMRQSMLNLAHPQAARDIAGLLVDLASGEVTRRD